MVCWSIAVLIIIRSFIGKWAPSFSVVAIIIAVFLKLAASHVFSAYRPGAPLSVSISFRAVVFTPGRLHWLISVLFKFVRLMIVSVKPFSALVCRVTLLLPLAPVLAQEEAKWFITSNTKVTYNIPFSLKAALETWLKVTTVTMSDVEMPNFRHSDSMWFLHSFINSYGKLLHPFWSMAQQTSCIESGKMPDALSVSIVSITFLCLQREMCMECLAIHQL